MKTDFYSSPRQLEFGGLSTNLIREAEGERGRKALTREQMTRKVRGP